MLSYKRRNKLEIFNDIITGISQESINGRVKSTRVAHIANMSYDKLSRYLEELNKKNLIENSSTIVITEKGKKFLQDYEKIHDFIIQMKLDYITETTHN